MITGSFFFFGQLQLNRKPIYNFWECTEVHTACFLTTAVWGVGSNIEFQLELTQSRLRANSALPRKNAE